MHHSDQFPHEGEASHSSHAVPPESVMSTAYPSRRMTRQPNTRLHGTCHPTTRFDRPHSRFGQTTFRGVIARYVVPPAVSPTPFGVPQYQLSLQMPVSLNVDLRLSRSRLSQGSQHGLGIPNRWLCYVGARKSPRPLGAPRWVTSIVCVVRSDRRATRCIVLVTESTLRR
jgi:hypothetical protein